MKKQKIKLIILRVILIMLAMIATFFTVFEILELIGQEPVKASNSGNTSDVQLLARAINGEARGEPYEGQVAVGAVILNRVKDSKFPNTIAGVIYQSGALQ